ncbi:39S ribosomal protein L52, mitochondrial-like [Pollicipes pollicipes]|uniref:39S ribosomal protein L52, mitochondrial-like n=1 Tax=Pollicipes pollicipes TaxID=41117 RepID=UPI0018852A69|nr:39S ribosomal protein L52, mitochondrial-like [Pollicipes pollicipes]XP_037085792.1 39S ribosomal protein L52, mitochondrial-like [Pollicipes pollicipes]XP_037085793.1 39S ribosomal protein L52, mitochondrial-like [Pollicipes pollicipes]
MALEMVLRVGQGIIHQSGLVSSASHVLSNVHRVCAVASIRWYKKIQAPPKPLPSKLQDWRREHQQPVNPTARGVLTDGPDYSYPDGRPVQAGTHQVRRATQHRQLMERIVQLTAEVDLAERLHAERTRQAQEHEQHLMRRRLKAKATETLDAK